MSLLLAWLVLHVARQHHLVQAPGPGLTVVVLTFLVLAQGGEGGVVCGHRSVGGDLFAELSTVLWPNYAVRCKGNAMHAVRTQCKVLDVGQYSNPSFGPF